MFVDRWLDYYRSSCLFLATLSKLVSLPPEKNRAIDRRT
jgi:hypothetical protein